MKRREVIRTWVATKPEADATVKRIAVAAKLEGKGHLVHAEPARGGGFQVIITGPE